VEGGQEFIVSSKTGPQPWTISSLTRHCVISSGHCMCIGPCKASITTAPASLSFEVTMIAAIFVAQYYIRDRSVRIFGCAHWECSDGCHLRHISSHTKLALGPFFGFISMRLGYRISCSTCAILMDIIDFITRCAVIVAFDAKMENSEADKERE
jgi:hypothetical protein